MCVLDTDSHNGKLLKSGSAWKRKREREKRKTETETTTHTHKLKFMPLSHEIFSMRNLLGNAPKFSTEDIKNTFAKMLLNLPLMMTAQPRPFHSQFLFLFLYFFPVHIFLLRSLFPPSTWAPLTNWKCNLAKVQHCVAYYCAPPRPSATLWPLPAACPLPCRQRGALAIVQAGQRTTEVAVSRWLKVPAVTQNVWKTMQFFHLSLPRTHTYMHMHTHMHKQSQKLHV